LHPGLRPAMQFAGISLTRHRLTGQILQAKKCPALLGILIDLL